MYRLIIQRLGSMVLLAALLGGAFWASKDLKVVTHVKNLAAITGVTAPNIVWPTVRQLANGTKKYLVIPIRYQDSDPNYFLSDAQWDAVFSTTKLEYAKFSNESLNLNFSRTLPVSLPRKYTDANKALFGSSLGSFDAFVELNMHSASDYPAGGGEIDQILCNKNIDINSYDGVIIVLEESQQRHADFQRRVGLITQDARGVQIGGIASPVYFETRDCATVNTHARVRGVVVLYVGQDYGAGTFEDNLAVESRVAGLLMHEFGHAIGFGHASAGDDEYGNMTDLMGRGRYGAYPGAYFRYLANWQSAPIIIAAPGDYQIHASNSNKEPAWAASNSAFGEFFEYFDGTLQNVAITPFPKTSQLMALKRNPMPTEIFGTLYSEVNRTTVDQAKGMLRIGQCFEVTNGSTIWFVKYLQDLLRVASLQDVIAGKAKLDCSRDLEVVALTFRPPNPVVGQVVQITAKMRNNGDEVIDYVDAVFSPLSGQELDSNLNLAPGSTANITYFWEPRLSGKWEIGVNAITYDDPIPDNNFKTALISVKTNDGWVTPRPKREYGALRFIGSIDKPNLSGTVTIRISNVLSRGYTDVVCEIQFDCGGEIPYGSEVRIISAVIRGGDLAGLGGDVSCTNMLENCATKIYKPTTTIIVMAKPLLSMTLTKSGVGAGKIQLGATEPNKAAQIVCTDCSGMYTFSIDTIIDLRATPDQGSVFESWGGPCVEDQNDKLHCQFKLNMDPANVSAIFGDCGVQNNSATNVLAPASSCASVTINKTGTGKGSIVSPQLSGINCDELCTTKSTSIVADSRSITLTATPNSQSTFAGWSGDAASCGTTASCTLVLNAGKTIGAKFEANKNFGLVERNPKGGITKITYTIPNQTPVTVTCTGSSCPGLPNPLPENTKLVLQMLPSQSNGNERLGPFRWDGQCSASINYNDPCTVTMPAGGMTIYVEFGYQWRVTISRGDTNGAVWVNTADGYEGTVSCSQGCAPGTQKDFWFFKGKTARVYARGSNDANGRQIYRVSHWTGECTAAKVGFCAISGRAAALSASFELIQYTLTVDKDCLGYGLMPDGKYCTDAAIKVYRNGVYLGMCDESCMSTGAVSMRGSDDWHIEYEMYDDGFINGTECYVDAGYDCSVVGDQNSNIINVTDKATGAWAYDAITRLRLVKHFRESSMFSPSQAAPRTKVQKVINVQFGTAPQAPVTQSGDPAKSIGFTQEKTTILSRGTGLAALRTSVTTLFSARFTARMKQFADLFPKMNQRKMLALVSAASGADLVAKDVNIFPSPVVPSAQHAISALVTNDGTLAYGDYFGVSLKIARNGAPAGEKPKEFYRYFSKLDVGGVAQVHWTEPWIPTVAGTYTLTLCVDRYKPIVDTNPANDCLAPFTVDVGSATAGLRTGPSPSSTGTVTLFYGDHADAVSSVIIGRQVPVGSAVTLVALPNTGMQFAGWIGEESSQCQYPDGRRSICQFTLKGLARIHASFVPKPAGALGDVNNDGKITASDALAILKVAVGQTVASFVRERADVTCDSRITAADALAVLKASVGSLTLDCANAAAHAAVTGDVAFRVSGTGAGTVAPSTPVTVTGGTKMTYTASPKTGSVFKGWGGDCTGTGTCSVTINGLKSANIIAQFEPLGAVAPVVTAPTTTTPETASGADLAPFGGNDLRVSPLKVFAGRAINVIAKFRNQGDAITQGSRVSLRIDKDNDGIWDFATADALLTLKKNQARSIKFKREYTPPAAGIYRYQVCVNDDAISIDQTLTTGIPEFKAGTGESNLANNCVENTFTTLPPRTSTATAGALAALTLLIGVPVGLVYLSKSRARILTML